MKKLLLVGVLSSSLGLFSCSLLQRRGGGAPAEENEAASAQPAENSEDATSGPLFTPGGQEVTASANAASNNENEVSRLNTKVAALETKVDVLSANLERIQAQKSQSVAQSEPARPQAHLAAPVSENAEMSDETTSQVSAAPAPLAGSPSAPLAGSPSAKLTRFPTTPKNFEADTPVKSGATTAAEKEFKAAMTLFQNGQNLDAASRFALVARKFPHHILASHSLYWAGEAAARAQQWPLAVENWTDLEKRYPRSAYMPETLSGLARAYDATGDATKAKYYRTVLVRAFPKSPVAMKSDSAPMEASVAHDISRRESAPLAAAPSSINDDPAPSFEEENGEPSGVTPTAPETVTQ